jgi:Type II secretion system (T2SS), protein M subtype b
MSQEHPTADNQVSARRQLSIPLAQIKRSKAVNIIGLPELIGLLGAGLLAAMVVFAYLYFYLPAQSRLTNIELERTRLQGQVQAARTQYQENDTINHTVARIDASLEDFETNWLPLQSSGRMTLYTVLNNLIKSNGLRNTSGPSYSALEVVGTKTQVQPGITAEKQSTAKWQSIYPGIAVTVTVEGNYPNIRHFVRDIETSRQFLIVNAVEIESVKNSGATQDQPLPATQPAQLRNARGSKPGTAAPPAPEIAGGRDGLVSLRLDIASYFQRPEAKQSPAN